MSGQYRSALRNLACLAVAGLALCACGAAASGTPAGQGTNASASGAPSPSSTRPASASVEAAGSPLWQLKWQTDFPQPAPLGSFTGCDNYDRTPAAFCSGLPTSVRPQWWAYPTGWPDTATEGRMRLGGYYDPAHTISISGGQMHIRMFRDTGPIHSATVVPKAAIGLTVPDEPMSWIMQNETALNGEIAPENSSAQLNISYVAVYTYAGKKT